VASDAGTTLPEPQIVGTLGPDNEAFGLVDADSGRGWPNDLWLWKCGQALGQARPEVNTSLTSVANVGHGWPRLATVGLSRSGSRAETQSKLRLVGPFGVGI
jgi:hypothetical protein